MSQRQPAALRRRMRWAPGGAGLLAPLLGVSAALLVSCGSSSSGRLIPLANAGPLQTDFQEVAQAAQAANGNCSDTEAKILKTEQDFAALPSGIDSGLRETLRKGIANLRAKALALCAQPAATTTATSGTSKTNSTPTTTTTTPTQTATTPTTNTSTTPPPTTTGQGGGTPAPGETPSEGGGAGAGEDGGGRGNGGVPPGQEK